MIKYFCDKCGQEITESNEKINIKVRCLKLLHIKEIALIMHNDCAVEFIGKEHIETAAKEIAERKKKREERNKEMAKSEEAIKALMEGGVG